MRKLLPAALLALSACATSSDDAARVAVPVAPGGSYAWVSFDAAGERARGAAGIADRTTGRRLTIDDPARVASVSKLVVALGVMRLVEQGRLDLDADVSGHLGWRLRNPAFPDVPITLRLLLSHRSSLTDDADYAIPLGGTLRGTAAKPAAFDRTHAPGTYFRYANLNFPIIASVMEHATGERFDRLMDRLVLTPLGLDACFNWTTCDAGRVERGVVLYAVDGSVRKDDAPSRRAACQVNTAGPSCDLGGYALGSNGALFSPQGGLRASARDLGVVGRMLLNRGRHGGRAFLTPASVDAMLAPAWTHDGTNGDTSGGFYCAYGLATQSLPVSAPGCRDDLLGGRRAAAGHAGEAFGLLSGLWIDRARGIGVAYFATANGEQTGTAGSAYEPVEEALARRIGR